MTIPTSSIPIAVLGSGRVGSTLATALTAAGHHVILGVRNPADTQHAVPTADIATAISTGDLIINATPGDTTLERLTEHRDRLAGKVLLDVSNATRRTDDGLPSGLLYPDTSLGELLQQHLPATKIVKSLNTMLFSVMTDPGSLTAPPTAFVSGDDAAAKQLVRGVLHDLGWNDAWILDLGGISTARGTEAMTLMVPSLLNSIGFTPFALSIAR